MKIYGAAYSDLEFLRSNRMGIEVFSHPVNLNDTNSYDGYHKTITEQIKGMNGVSMHGVFNDMAYASGDPLILEVVKNRFIESIQAASLHDINSLIFHSAFRSYHGVKTVEKWYIKASIDFWKDFQTNIPDEMTVLLENVEDEDPVVFLQILQGIDSPKICCCFDVGHAFIYSSIPLNKWIRSLVKYIKHVHINDNDGKRDLHLPLGKGIIPLVTTIQDILENVDKEVPFTLECDAPSSVEWLKEKELI